MNEGQKIQWTKEKGEKDKQQSTKHYTENNNLQNTTQKTTIYKILHRKLNIEQNKSHKNQG
jgi:predicted transcriptional regulator